jgi:hypothetical protein
MNSYRSIEMLKPIIAVVVLLFSSIAAAADIEVAVGASRLDETNGIFYYDNLWHQNTLDSQALQVGIAGYWRGHRIRTGYQYFGHVTQKSTIYTEMKDGNCHPGQECGPGYRWEGEGTAQGIYLQWEPEYKQGAWRYFADVGPMLVKARWQEKVIGGFPPNSTVDSPNDYRVKWLGFALGIEYKNVALVYQHQPLSSSSDITFYTYADSVMLRVRF